MKKIILSLVAITMAIGTMLADTVTFDFTSTTSPAPTYGSNLEVGATTYGAKPTTMTNGAVSVVLTTSVPTNTSNGFKLSTSGLLAVSGAGALNANTPNASLTFSVPGGGKITGVKINAAAAYKVGFNSTTSLTTAANGAFTWTGEVESLPVYIGNVAATNLITSIVVDYTSTAAPALKDPELSFNVDEYTYYIHDTNDDAPVLNNPNGLEVQYSSSDESIGWYMSFSGFNSVVGLAEGTCTINAKSAPTDEYEAGEASFTLIVKDSRTESAVVFPTELNVTCDAKSGSFEKNTDYGLLAYIGTFDTEGTSVNVTVATPAEWDAVYYVEPSAGGISTSLHKNAPAAQADDAEWEAADTFDGKKGNTFSVPADGVTYEYQIYLATDAQGVYTGKHAMVSVTAYPPFEAPAQLSVTCQELPDVTLKYVDAADSDFSCPTIVATATVIDQDPETLTFDFDLPVGWTAMYHSPIQGPETATKANAPAAQATTDDFEWVAEEQLEAANYERSKQLGFTTETAGEYNVQIYLAKDGQVATSNPYAFQLNLSTTATPAYVQKEYNIVVGGISTQMTYEGENEEGAGVYSVLLDQVAIEDTIVISQSTTDDDEGAMYAVDGTLELNNETPAALVVFHEGDTAGHLSSDATQVTFTFFDNPAKNSYTLKAIGTVYERYTEWVIVTPEGMTNLNLTKTVEASASNNYDDYTEYTATLPLMMSSTNFYIKNTKTNQALSTGETVTLNDANYTSLMTVDGESWMHLNVNAENVTFTFENHGNWEMQTLRVTGTEAGTTSDWTLVLNGENKVFGVKDADLANENYTYELTVPELKSTDSFYILNTKTGNKYSTGGALSVNSEYESPMAQYDTDVAMMSVAGDWENVTFTFNNNVGWEMMSLKVSGTLAGATAGGYYLKGNNVNNGNGDFEPGANAYKFTKMEDTNGFYYYGPIEFGSFKSFAIWGGEEGKWYSSNTNTQSWLNTLDANTQYPLKEVGEMYAMQPTEQGTYYVMANFATPSAPYVVVATDLTVSVGSLAADEAEAVYYDLNGVRVENPESGVYIRVAGGKATTVFIKK